MQPTPNNVPLTNPPGPPGPAGSVMWVQQQQQQQQQLFPPHVQQQQLPAGTSPGATSTSLTPPHFQPLQPMVAPSPFRTNLTPQQTGLLHHVTGQPPPGYLPHDPMNASFNSVSSNHSAISGGQGVTPTLVPTMPVLMANHQIVTHRPMPGCVPVMSPIVQPMADIAPARLDTRGSTLTSLPVAGPPLPMASPFPPHQQQPTQDGMFYLSPQSMPPGVVAGGAAPQNSMVPPPANVSPQQMPMTGVPSQQPIFPSHGVTNPSTPIVNHQQQLQLQQQQPQFVGVGGAAGAAAPASSKKQQQRAAQVLNTMKVYIRHLGVSVTEEDIRRFASNFGGVRSVVKQREKGLAAGAAASSACCYLTFDTVNAAQLCVEKGHGSLYFAHLAMDRGELTQLPALSVRMAESLEDRRDRMKRAKASKKTALEQVKIPSSNSTTSLREDEGEEVGEPLDVVPSGSHHPEPASQGVTAGLVPVVSTKSGIPSSLSESFDQSIEQ